MTDIELQDVMRTVFNNIHVTPPLHKDLLPSGEIMLSIVLEPLPVEVASTKPPDPPEARDKPAPKRSTRKKPENADS